MRRDLRAALALCVIIIGIALMGSSCQSLGDKGGVEGAPPDGVADVDYSIVFRNADNYPNVNQICVAGLGFASTSTGRGESGGATPLIRVPDWDPFCKTKVHP
jgi:hypothetical protein